MKFTLVGGVGTIFDFLVTALCREVLGLNRYVANSLGFICVATANFVLNRFWTFASTDPDITGQYIFFMGFALAGLLLNNGVVWLLHDRFGIRFYVAKAIATVVTGLWNFTMNAIFTFAI